MTVINVNKYSNLNLLPKVNLLKLLFICLIITSFSDAKADNFYHPSDSVGLETLNGKTFILHKVKSGETLYSLSRRYKVKVAQILEANPSTKEGLKIERTIKIPYEKKVPLADGTIYHEVKSSETMYAISRKYKVKLSEIKAWNNLESTTLKVGQKLIIHTKGGGQQSSNKVKATPVVVRDSGEKLHTVGASETLYGISKKYNVSITDLRRWNNLSSVSLKVGQKLVIKPNKKTDAEVTIPEKNTVRNNKKENKSKKTNKKEPENSDFKDYESSMEDIKRVNTKASARPKGNASAFNKVVELGFAEVIKTEKNSKKWLALHRTAPIGTILRVKNEMNNLWVFVRVVGKLPETSVNDKVLIKLSKTAYDKLGAINARFPVEISYIP